MNPVLDDDGNVVNFIAIENDITNRKRREIELVESRNQTEEVLHELELRQMATDKHSIVAITDTKGTIQYVDDLFCEVSQYTKEEILGQNHRMLNSDHHDEAFWKDMYSTIGKGEVWQGTIRNRRKDGSYYWLRTTITPFTNPRTGKINRYVAIRTDITARIEAEQELKKTLDGLEELVQQKTEKLQLAHDGIMESLNYAQRLQRTPIPSVSELKKVVSNAGVILRPRDIVTGDFYWFEDFGDELMVALVDCTGHGVPGAMMSMLANELLNSLISQKHIFRPDVVLEELDIMLVEQLMRDDSDYQMADGMDMALVSIDRRNGLFSFAGAKSHGIYYHCKKNKFRVLKPDRHSVGGALDGIMKDFTRTRFDYEAGDRFFLFSDGIYDQFGGPKGKKFLRKRLSELIQNTNDRPVDEQVRLIEKQFLKWMGDNPQVDDVSLIGIEL